MSDNRDRWERTAFWPQLLQSAPESRSTRLPQKTTSELSCRKKRLLSSRPKLLRGEPIQGTPRRGLKYILISFYNGSSSHLRNFLRHTCGAGRPEPNRQHWPHGSCQVRQVCRRYVLRVYFHSHAVVLEKVYGGRLAKHWRQVLC